MLKWTLYKLRIIVQVVKKTLNSQIFCGRRTIKNLGSVAITWCVIKESPFSKVVEVSRTSELHMRKILIHSETKSVSKLTQFARFPSFLAEKISKKAEPQPKVFV